MEISKNRSATARKSSEQPRQDTAKTALITPLRSLYSFIFPHQSSRHGIALFRPLGSIRALAPAMCSLRCAHTPTQPPYFAIAPYGLSVALFRPLGSIRALVIPGLRYAYPGLYSGAPSGRSISYRPIAHICHRQMSTLHRPIAHICHRQIEVYPVSRTLLGLGVRYSLGQFSLSDYDSIGPSSMLSIYPFEYLALSCKG